MPEPARTPRQLIGEWLTITPVADELRALLRRYPLQTADLMPECSGWAAGGRLWLDGGLIADPDRSARWLLAVYLHECAHCHLQDRGRGGGHDERFAKHAWGLAIRHGVEQYVDTGYDLHESRRRDGAGHAIASAGAAHLAAGAVDPLTRSDRDWWHDYTTFYSVLFSALAVAFVGAGGWIAAQAGWLSSLPDLGLSDWTPRAAGFAVLAGALWRALK